MADPTPTPTPHPRIQRIVALAKTLLPILLVLVPAFAGGYGLHAWKSRQVDPPVPVVSGTPLAFWQRISAQGPAGQVQFLTAPGLASGSESLVFPDAVYTLTPIGVNPTPPGPIPVPPGPTPPGPVPPTPPNPPGPPPIPGAGLRVLFVEDVTARDRLSAGQREVLFSQAPGGVLDYLRQNAAQGTDGKTPEFRIFDKTNGAERESDTWKAAVAKFRSLNPPPALPAWMVSNGSGGVAGSLPATAPEAIDVLKRWTPAKGGK